MITKYLNSLPDVHKYPEETWEWTIGRNFKDQVSETAAFHLQSAIPVAAVDPSALLEAVYWLETSVILEEGDPMTSLLKNAGLSHLHLLQNKAVKQAGNLPTPALDIFQSLGVIKWPSKENDE